MIAHPKKSYYPIIIVGGGLVGASLSIALKQVGVEVLVLEAFEQSSNQQPSFDDRSVALSLSSLKYFETLGLGDGLYNKSQPIENIHVSDQGHYGFSRLESKKLRLPKLGAVIENKVLGNTLLDKIALDKIEYCCPAKVENVEISEKKNIAFVELEKSNPTEKKLKISCDLLILAEGSRSTLKKALGFESQITNFEASAIVCNVKTQLPHNNWAFERFTKNGPLALLPLSHNRLSIVWSNSHQKSAQLMELSDNGFSSALEKKFGARLGRFEQVGKRIKFPLTQEVSENNIKEHCLLIGNSAQSLHPIGGQGLNLALRDIKSLQIKLEASLKENPDLSLGDYHWLQKYQHERKADRNDTIETTESLARLFANDWLPLSISRNLLMKVMDVTPFLKQSFALKAMGFKA